MRLNKHWKVISVALLMAIGGIGMVNHNNVRADSTNNDTPEQMYDPQISDEDTLVQTNPGQSEANQSNFTQQANSLHSQIIKNNVNSAASAPADVSDDDTDFNFDLPDLYNSSNDFNSDFSDTLTNTKSEANSLSAETSKADQTSHPNYQMSFSSESNSSAFGYNYYFASSASNGSVSNRLADSISTDINDDMDDSFNWMSSMDNQMNSEFNAVNSAFGEDNFDNNLFIPQPALEPGFNESSSASSKNDIQSSSQSSNNENSSDYNAFTVPKNNRAWNYVMNGTDGTPDYSDDSNTNDSNSSIDDILDQISNLNDELDSDINSIFNNSWF